MRPDRGEIGSRRLAAFFEFVVARLPSPPARVLELGCGDGRLAVALARACHDVTAIDPRAPEGEIFRRTTLEEFSTDRTFDAVVASVSLHHVEDVGAGVAKIHELLRPGGLVILEEFDRERLAGATARWYHEQRQRLAAGRPDEEPLPADWRAWLARWEEEHADVHPFRELRRELDARFAERHFALIPYLYDYRLEDGLEPVECALVESGAIEATGIRYVGARRA